MTNAPSRGGNLEGGERPAEKLRLFLALVVPDEVVRAVAAWREEHLLGGAAPGGAGGVRPAEGFHVTLAFLGSRPRGELDGIVGALRESAAEAGPFTLEPVRYRETRSVGMLVLADPSGQAARLAERLQERLEALGVYEREARPWLPHTTLIRFRERPRLTPPLPELGPFAPSEAAAFVSRLHRSGARYEIVEKCPLRQV